MGLMDKIKNILVIPDEDELENEVEETVEKPEAKNNEYLFPNFYKPNEFVQFHYLIFLVTFRQA